MGIVMMKRAAWTTSALVFLWTGAVGCTEDDPATEVRPPTATFPVTEVPTPWAPMVVEAPAVTTFVETLVDVPVRSAVPLGPADLVVVQNDRVERLDAVGSTMLWGFALPQLRAAAPWGPSTLLATADGLVTYDAGFVPTELDDVVDDVTELLALRSGLWMQTATGLMVWREGSVQAVRVGEVHATGMARGQAGVAPVVWTHADTQVVAVNFTNEGLVPYEAATLFGTVDDLAADAAGNAFAVVDGWLVERTRTDEWTRLDVGSPVRELLGHDGGPTVWARTDDSWLARTPEGWRTTDVPIDRRGTLDTLGRLVTRTEAGVERYSLDRPVLLLGLPDANLVAPTEILIAPAVRATSPTLSVTATGLDGVPVTVPVEEGSFVLDPELLGDGLWSIEVTADYGDGTATLTVDVTLGADFIPTWTDHIEPLYASQCTPCHEGGQGVVALDTEASWIQFLDVGTSPTSAGILDRVAIDNMPSDARIVSPIEKALLRRWAESLP